MVNKVNLVGCDGECSVCNKKECIFKDPPEEITPIKNNNDIPKCGLYRIDTPSGAECDCEYNPSFSCEECLVNWEIGGHKDPRVLEIDDDDA